MAALIKAKIPSQYLFLEGGDLEADINDLPKKRGITETAMPHKAATGEQGFEPRSAEPESAVLPLDDSPSLKSYCSTFKPDEQILRLPSKPAFSLAQPLGTG